MRSLDFLPSTRLNQLQLIDIAVVLAMLPHLLILKWPMLLFLIAGSIFIIRKKDSQNTLYAFMFLGALAIGLSFFAEYNFSSFSRLLVYISLLVSLLTYAIVLQRLTRQLCIYLLLAPAMLMSLAFFFYNSIGMLFYSLFTLFVFTLLILYEHMQSSLMNALRINALLYLFSLPIVLMLFLVFPRISYKNAGFGFKGEEIIRSGHDGNMYIDSNALLVPSSKLVMEVSFEKELPSERYLYFRGSTLYVDNQKKWTHGEKSPIQNQRVLEAKDIINYRINLYPHKKRFVYMLDLPLRVPPKSSIDSDYIVMSETPLEENFDYKASSALSYKTVEVSEKEKEKALIFDPIRDPRVYEKLFESVDINEYDTVKVQKLIDFFRSLDLSYSLRPKPMDLEHPVDSFLLDSKIGYCVHFASSFATSARMIGLPSRVVTGYKGNIANAVNNYLIVTEADAHAWVEIYLKERGWVRFEPTATARRFIQSEQRGLSNTYAKSSAINTFFKEINIRYMYTRHVINTWILQYDRSKQVSLLKEILSSTLFMLKFAASFIGIILLSFLVFMLLQKRRCEDVLLCEMQSLIQFLKAKGFMRKQGETMFDFLRRVADKDPKFSGINEVNRCYHEARYAKASEKGPALLRESIRAFKDSLTNG